MGYLDIPTSSLANFQKAVISIWFRIPSAVLSAVSSLTDSPAGAQGDGFEGACFSPRLHKIIPLVTFGSLETGTGYAAGAPVQPSFVGVDCSHVADGRPARVAVNLQTHVTCSFNKTPQHPELEARPQCFYMNGDGYAAGAHALTVTPDVWHHILISFDLSAACSITYANFFRSPPDPAFAASLGPTFSWAFDDQNKVGKSMLPSGSGDNNWGIGDPGSTAGDQHILPNGFFSIWTGDDLSTTPIEDSTDFAVSIGASSILSSGNAIGIPTSATFVDNVYNIEIAEVQFFTGVSVDAGSETIRRLFVKADGTPEKASVATAELGVSPKIYLHNIDDFSTGNNSGTIGNFTPTGTIMAFTPGPDITP